MSNRNLLRVLIALAGTIVAIAGFMILSSAG